MWAIVGMAAREREKAERRSRSPPMKREPKPIAPPEEPNNEPQYVVDREKVSYELLVYLERT